MYKEKRLLSTLSIVRRCIDRSKAEEEGDKVVVIMGGCCCCCRVDAGIVDGGNETPMPKQNGKHLNYAAEV